MKVYWRVYRYEYVNRHHNVGKIRALVYSKILFQELDKIKKDPLNYMEKPGDEDFLRFVWGLLDSDGTVTDRIVLYSSSKPLLESISERLESFPVKSHIYRFDTIFGLQIHDENSLLTLSRMLSPGKLRAPARLKNIGSRKTERFWMAPQSWPAGVPETRVQPG